jgi:hypothetical protein
MIKKITALWVLFLFAGQLTASFLHFDCDMFCCQESVDSCCAIEPVVKECPTIGESCKTVVFLPIVSGPTVKFEINNELFQMGQIPTGRILETVKVLIVDYYLIHPLAEPPPAFDLPLLI